MTKKEFKDRINSFGNIIKVRHNNEPYENYTFSDFKQYIDSEYKFWKAIDESKKTQKGYSESYSIIKEALEGILNNGNKELIERPSDLITQLRVGLSNIHRVQCEQSSFKLNMCKSEDIARYGLKNEYAKAIRDDEEQIKILVDLYKGVKNVNACLNDINSTEFKSAITFLGLETKNIKRNKDEEINTKIDEVLNRISELKNRNIEFENDINEYTNTFKKTSENWLEEKNQQADNLEALFQTRMGELEKAYDEKLKLSEPVKYWEEQSDKMKTQFYWYVFASVILTGIILVSGYKLVSMTYEYAANNTNIERIIPFSFVMIGIVTLLIYLLRTVIKLMISSKHLELEYNQKAKFTYFFLTMLKKSDGDIPITDSEQGMIYQTLFTVPDTGLLKGGDSADVNTLLMALFSKMPK